MMRRRSAGNSFRCQHCAQRFGPAGAGAQIEHSVLEVKLVVELPLVAGEDQVDDNNGTKRTITLGLLDTARQVKSVKSSLTRKF